MWYYAEGSERRGPVAESEVQQLIREGRVRADTLVWTAGQAAWLPLAQSPLAPHLAATAGRHPCIITGRTFPESEMVKTEHGWVSAEGKDLYYQALREGVAPERIGTNVIAWSDRGKLVVPVTGARLPARCVKTNRLVTDSQFKARTLYWAHPAVYLAILVNLLVLLIIYLIIRKKVVVEIPLSTEARASLRLHLAASIGGFLAGVGLVVIPFAVNFTPIYVPLLAGLVLIVGSLIYGNIKATALRVSRVRDGKAWLVGACPEFLVSLPPYPG